MDKLNVLDHSTNVNNTNEVHINFEDKSNEISVTSINSVSEKLINEITSIDNEVVSTAETTVDEAASIDNSTEKNLTPTEESTECTSLIEVKPHSLLVAQTMFKKSIKISIKTFLISLSLGFLNLFF